MKQRTVLTARGVACELLKDLSEDIIIPLQQREDKASYYSHPEGLELDFNKSSEENHAVLGRFTPGVNPGFIINPYLLYLMYIKLS